MSFLGNLVNAAGATALRTTGSVTPRLGPLANVRDAQFQAANNITNPYVNYLGHANPSTPIVGNNKPLASYSQQTQGATTGPYNPGQRGNQAVIQAFDTQIGGLGRILGTLQPAQDAATLQLNNQWQNQRNALDKQRSTGMSELDRAGNQIQYQKAQSLADLQRQLQGSLQGYNSQLGAMGAGNSSATGLIQQAVAGMGSRNRGDVLRSATEQQGQVDLQRNQLEDEYSSNVKALDDWKQKTYLDLVNQYAQQKFNIQQQIAGATGQKAQYLQQQGAALDQSILDGLANLSSQYEEYANGLIGRYQNFTAPDLQIAPNLQQYEVQPITPGELQQVSVAPQQPTDESGLAATSAFLKRLQDQPVGA